MRDREPPVKGALEATTSGLNLLREHDVPFPVFDWNSIPLKDRLENRFHVGNDVWPVFREVTSMNLYRPVGAGGRLWPRRQRHRRARARPGRGDLYVADLDAVRLHRSCSITAAGR